MSRTMMNYQQTCQFLYSKLPNYERQGSGGYKQGLDGMMLLCAAMGNPQNDIRCIHIAGTNGKGSVASMLAACLQIAGYKTGLYTSPHLVSLTERIKIDGVEITQQQVVDFVHDYSSVIETLNPSFFEIMTAMALRHFAINKVNAAVIEAGLGGRLDSTNIITPMLSVITCIERDHCAILGDTLPQIAAQKAGIIKADTPIVIGRRHPLCNRVFDSAARRMHAPIMYAQQRYKVIGRMSDGYSHFCIRSVDGEKRHFDLDLCGAWQGENLCTALCAADMLADNIAIPEAMLGAGFSHAAWLTGLRGRWQRLRSNPLVIADIAHNPDAIARTMKQVANTTYNRLHIVFGIAADKEIDAIAPLLPSDACYYFTQACSPRAMASQALAQHAAHSGGIYPDVKSAIEAAMAAAAPDDMIYIGGSSMVVGEALQVLK